MIKRGARVVVWLLAGLWGGQALAQDLESSEPSIPSGGQGWSMLSGQALGNGENAFSLQLGWPGLSASFLHGATPKLDLGARFSFNYGYEGIVTQSLMPGMKMQALIRVALLQARRVNLGLSFAPGPLFYYPRFYSIVGLSLPMSLTAGLPVGSALMLHGGVDFPMFVVFGSGGGLRFPILVGAGAEYFLDRTLALSFDVRMGPSIDTRARYGYAEFAFECLVGVAYKL